MWRSKLIVTSVASDLAIKVIVSIILSIQASPLPRSSLARSVNPCLQSAMSNSMAGIIGASGVIVADSQPDRPGSMDEAHGRMDWRFWLVLVILVIMAVRQLLQDLLVLIEWIFPASPVTPEAVPSVTDPSVLAAAITMESSTDDAISMVMPDVATSTAGSMPPPSVPIFVSRYGEKYHYTKECSGFMAANLVGIECRTLCKTCHAQRRR